MAKILSPWCKEAKIALIRRDIPTYKLAEDVGLTKEYVSSILNGRVRSPEAERKISDYLGIPYADT